MTIRAFLAFPISGVLKERIKYILDDLQETNADVKWVTPQNIHLTLKFLGELEENAIANVSSMLRERCRGFFPITSHLNEIGAFPDLRHPKIVWAALDDSSKEICAIVENLEGELAKLGIAQDEHPFKPHITLGRVRSSANLKNLIQAIQQITFEDSTEQIFDIIILYKSTLTMQGPIYEVLEKFEMARGGIRK